LRKLLQQLLHGVCYVLSKKLAGGIVMAELPVGTVEGDINDGIE
jgi:hypothetical protein